MIKNLKSISFSISEKFFILFLVVYTLYGLLLFSNFVNNYEINNLDNESCSYFIPPNINQIDQYQINIEERDVYVIPEVQNILCIGKVVNYELKDNSILTYIGTNSKFINYLIFLTQLIVLVLYLFIFNKYNYRILNTLLIIFFIYSYFYSLDAVSYFLFILFPTIFYFLNNTKEIPEEISSIFSKRDIFYLSSLFLGFMIIQFSSHHYETIDWDINAFLVTAMDTGRGNLPLENQFENKPPLLFFIYYLFGSIGGGDLLPVKILNDLVLFSSVFIMYYILKKKSNNSSEPIIASSIFILFTSNYWFHPGFSEIFSVFFIAMAYLLIVESKNSVKRIIFSGVFLALASLINIGSAIFIIGFSLIIVIRLKSYLKNIVCFYFGFSVIHLLFLFAYFLNNLTIEYLIPTILIPLSYVSTDFFFFPEIRIFLDSLLNYNILIFILLSICFVNVVSKPLILTTNKIRFQDNLSLSELILVTNSLLFYYFAAKGYYHHLIFFLFFVCFGITNIPTSKYKLFLFSLVMITFLQITNQFSNQAFNNISNLNIIEENYPVKRVADSIKLEMEEGDKIFSTDNILMLYYLDKPNTSYIVHPALYYYEEITSVLIKYNKIKIDEKNYQILLKPKFVEGFIKDIEELDYHKIQSNEFETYLINYFDRNKNIDLYVNKP
tara:strand:- start:51 stop:2051 length:2001 start_codon:yes stop_codon:yes gene_type:complete